MKNFTIAIAVLLVMASFTTNLTNSSTVVLSDYEGTLLESAPILENNDGDVKVTFMFLHFLLNTHRLNLVCIPKYIVENRNINIGLDKP